MSDCRELYQETLLDHNRNPRNFRVMEHPTHRAEGYNPLCGDRVTLYVKLEGDRIADISFQGSGCAISTASASLLTLSLKGKTRAEAEALFGCFHDLVTGSSDASTSPDTSAALGKLAVFSGVREFPMRVKCATLSWHAFQSALRGGDQSVSTE